MNNATGYPMFTTYIISVNNAEVRNYIEYLFSYFYEKHNLRTDEEMREKNIDLCLSLSKCEIHFLDPQEVASKLSRYTPEKRLTLEKKRKLLKQIMMSLLPLPNNEKIISAEITCLKNNLERFAAGQVVYVRETNAAKIACILEYVRLNLDTGEFEPMILPTASESGAKKDAVPSPQVLGSSQAEQNAIAAGVMVKFYKNFTFLLPAPWSVVTDTGLSLFEMLLPAGEEENPVQDAVNAVNQFTALHMARQKVVEWSNTIRSFAEWINDKQTVLKQTNTKFNNEYIKEQILANLITATGSEGRLYNALQGLSKPKSILDDPNFEFSDVQNEYNKKNDKLKVINDCMRLMTIGTSFYLLARKFQVQLYAQLAANVKDDLNQTAFLTNTSSAHGSFISFKNSSIGGESVIGWPDKILPLIDEVIADTLKISVGPVYRVSFDPGPSGGSQGGYWGFRYYENDICQETMFSDEGGCCPVQREQEARIARQQKHEQTSNTLQQSYQALRNGITKLKSCHIDWEDKITLTPPQIAPKINPNLDKWQENAPQGSNWRKGNAVRYAVGFLQQKGADESLDFPSEISPFGGWVNITTKAFPTVEIPVDQRGKATGRAIYRQFRNTNPPIIELVEKIRNNTNTELVDKKE